MRRVGIVGTGLIGASVGMGLSGQGVEIVGYDADPSALDQAVRRGAVTAPLSSAEAVFGAGCDLVVLAAPPDAVVELLRGHDGDGLLTDVAGVKGPVLAARRRGTRFVGGHPMAGREMSGPAAASPALFRGAAWVVVPDGAADEDVAVVEDLAGRLGARPIRMEAGAHDEAVAVVSHLPQLIAATLVNEASDRTAAMELVAGSFRDLTRVAASDAGVWVQLLRSNSPAVRAVIADMRDRLGLVDRLLEADDVGGLAAMLTRASRTRVGMAPPVVGVRVALADEPGELAKVGRALEESGVDVRDLQLRHAPHGGGGVLTISVRPGEAETLRGGLEHQGLLLFADDAPGGGSVQQTEE